MANRFVQWRSRHTECSNRRHRHLHGARNSFKLPSQIVVPASGYIRQHPGTGVYHVHDTASVGFQADIFFKRLTSLKVISFQEGTATGMCTGAFTSECGPHPPTLFPVLVGNSNVAAGCMVLSNGNWQPSDTVESKPIIGPFPPSSTYEWDIPWQFLVGASSPVTFSTAIHLASIEGQGKMDQQGRIG
jgi:hypothetical protein